MMRALAAALLFCLAACASPGPIAAPIPVSQDLAAPVARPGAVVFQAAFAQPDLGVGLACTEDSPPDCTGLTATWGTFDRPGPQGRDCVDPAPNPCFSVVDGVLRYDATAGFPIISRETFDAGGAISLEVVLTALPYADESFAGPVIYNGERNYRALYFTQMGGVIQAWVYQPVSYAGPISPQIYARGSRHALRLDYRAGVWTYYVDGVLLLTETENSLSGDPVLLAADPHIALFLGSTRGEIARVDVTASRD